MARDLKDVFEFGPFRLDAEDGSLRRGDEVVPLPHKAGDLLVLLVEQPGIVRSREELVTRVWDANVAAASVDYQIHLIRRALGKDQDGDDFIQTVHRRGFRFTKTVRRVHRTNDRIVDTPAAPAVPPVPGPQPATSPRETAVPRTLGRRPSFVLAASMVAGVSLAVAAAVGLVPPESLRIVESRALTQGQPAVLGYPVLTDGGRVYFRAAPDGQRWVVPVSGGAAAEVFPPPAGLWLADPGRPGGDSLAIRSTREGVEGELWIVPSGSGVPRRVGPLTAYQAAWSPDGNRIALVSRQRLSLADREGADVVAVEGPPRSSDVQHPRWSPDGTLVRFTVSTPAQAPLPETTIWEVRRDGTGLRPVLPRWDATVGACCGVWSPDGRDFVFQGTRGDRRSDLWVLTEPAGLRAWLGRRPPPTQLTAGPLSLTGPAMSPDGRTLFAVGALARGELVRWDRGSRAFVPYLGGLSGTWVAFSRDRQWVAYVGYPDRRLWRVRMDGTERRALTGGDFELDGTAWSPDGRWISFRSRMAGRHMRNFLVPSSGGAPVPISEDDQEQGIASWSADGAQLVFGDVPAQFGVPAGSEALRLYDVHRKAFSTVPGSEGLWTARWSPDGRFIAALTNDHEQRMKVFDTATRQWRGLDADHVNNPTWSRDSRFVHYHTEGGISALRRVRVSDGRVEDLAPLDVPLVDTDWSGLALDDSPMVLRNLSAPSVYAFTLKRGR